METSGWKGDPKDRGAFGTEVHRRVAQQLPAKTKYPGQWLFDVYVDQKTNKVLSIGAPPQGGVAGTTQIDILLLKGKKTLQVGDTLTPDVIKNIYEIKTSISGYVHSDQLKRLRLAKAGLNPIAAQTATITVVGTARRWTASMGWHDNPKYGVGKKILSVVGAVGLFSGAAYATSPEADRDLHDIAQKVAKIRNENDPTVRAADQVLLLGGPIRSFLAKIGLDNLATDVAIGLAIREILKD